MKKIVTSRSGDKIMVDTSDEACSEFGFKHGDRVEVPRCGKATVEGVGTFKLLNIKVLWYQLDNEDGASFTHPPAIKLA